MRRWNGWRSGPVIEAHLRAAAYMREHYLQSCANSTLGSWIVIRSSGQESLCQGPIEQLFGGGLLLAPTGELDLPTVLASAAGPDLRQLVPASEGRLGVVHRGHGPATIAARTRIR